MALDMGAILRENPITLAPMAGITDKAFRIIARNHGCGLIYTEMVSAKALLYNNKATQSLVDLTGEDPPIAVQLFGSEPPLMAEAARIAASAGASVIDVNMGCPVPKVVKNQEGSALLEKPELAGKIVKEIVRAVEIPVTVKMRIGWTKENIVALDFAKGMQDAGASAVAIHGRTREQFYSGKADWEMIKRVKEALVIPVIGNGDIWTPSDAKNMLELTGCDGVMVGRGALGNPWLISRIGNFLAGKEEKLPAPGQKIKGAIQHLDLVVCLKGELQGVREMRKHLAWYLKGLPRTARIKDSIFRAKTRLEVTNILEEYMETLAG